MGVLCLTLVNITKDKPLTGSKARFSFESNGKLCRAPRNHVKTIYDTNIKVFKDI